MAKLELSYTELLTVIKPIIPEEVTDLKTDGENINFTYVAEIIGFKKTVPITLSYSDYSKNSISFSYSINLRAFEKKVIGSYLGILEEKTKGIIKIENNMVTINIDRIPNLNLRFSFIEKVRDGLSFILEI